MARFQKCGMLLGMLLAASLAFVSAESQDFEEEFNFLKNFLANERSDVNELGFTPITPLLALTMPNLISKHRYPSETHTVRTRDGYLLSLHRIPNPGRPPVFVQHGLLSSSADFVVTGPGRALAFVLYDAGYDVWLGNSRGSTYSRDHVSLTPSQAEFWDFSWHEIGVHDLPASIDAVLQKTNRTDLVYIGHSQGTTAFFVMASERPEYNDKVRGMFALAPVAYMNQVRSFPLRVLSAATDQLEIFTRLTGLNEFLPLTDFVQSLTTHLCKDKALSQPLCTNILFMICGADSLQLNTTMIPAIMQNLPAGASTRQVVHYGQLIKQSTPTFRKYDYGPFVNMGRYGSDLPPNYNLSRITTPVHLIYGENDLLAVPQAVYLLYKALPNPMEYTRVAFDQWNHMDFLYGTDAPDLVYSSILTQMAEFYPPISSV